MPNNSSWLEKLRGKRTTDIDLPNESGVIDPRLEALVTPQQKKEAFDAAQTAALKGLRSVGQ